MVSGFAMATWLYGCKHDGEGKDPRTPLDPVAQDADGDGLTAEEDCDDGDAVKGGAEAPYDGIDNDCDATTLDDDLDSDGRLLADDCDDTDPLLGGPELASDGIDNDCDSIVDCDDTVLDSVGVWQGDLSSLEGIHFCEGYCARSVTGNLVIRGSAVTNLAGLACLTAIGGDLVIFHNTALESLEGLENLTMVPGELFIAGNPALSSLSGLQNLNSIENDFTIGYDNFEDEEYVYYSNVSLTSLSGLEGLATIGGDLSIYSAESLISLSGLENLHSIGGDLVIGYHNDDDDFPGNDALTSLDGLDTLGSVGGDLFIGYNLALVDMLSLYGLTTVTDVSILDNPVLTDTAALALVSEIESIGGTVSVTGNN